MQGEFPHSVSACLPVDGMGAVRKGTKDTPPDNPLLLMAIPTALPSLR